MAAVAASSPPYDVKLSPGTDLLAFTRESQGLAASSYTTPLIIPAAAANADSQTSPYFFSFGSGSYNYATNSSCHMAPAYLPTAEGVSLTPWTTFSFSPLITVLLTQRIIFGAKPLPTPPALN